MIPTLSKSVVAMVVLTSIAVAIRRGPATVAAFSIAAIGSSSRTTAAVSRPVRKVFTDAFEQRGFSRRFAGIPTVPFSITALRQSTLVATELEKSLEVTHPAFEVVKKDVIKEYGAYCTLFRHKRTGAELLSVSTDDDNKVFGITFRTPPSDSTGVPHILEHSVLCGSRKYTTKDPFVQLLQGSLQTFLNAMTFGDKTVYCVASQNAKDFNNLVSVYVDAVFFPRSNWDENVLAQEGWHLELEDIDDPITFKGVVYNEMKGVYSSPDSLLSRESQRSIFPDNTYSVDSGGDPRAIPDLSFEQFTEFHRQYYHPANSRIYFYGDDDVYARLELMDEYLREFDSSPESKAASQIQWQKKNFHEPKRQRHFYPVSGEQPENHMITINWLLNDRPLTLTEELTLGILDHLLLGTSSSTLRKALLESGLGEAITGGGLSDDLLQSTFSVGLKGIQPQKVQDVENLVMDVLSKVAKHGFSDDDIAASMNTIEFQLREFNTGSFPKGLSLLLGSLSKWLYDESPTEGLKFEEPLAELKATISKSGSEVFQKMVRELFLENAHRTTIEMVPSKTLENELLKEEQDRLAMIKAQLSESELKQIIAKTVELKQIQASDDSPEARATIPRLELKDLKREVVEYPIEVTSNEGGTGITVLRHELGSTSGIAYVNFGVDLSILSLDDAPLLPLFSRLLKEAGAGEYDDVALSRRIGTHTGGIDVRVMVSAAYPEGADESKISEGEHLVTKLLLKGKATCDKTDELFSIFHLILTEARLDSRSKAIEILKETRSRLESMIQGSGHSFANNRMKARYRVGGYVDEIMGGISHLDTVKSLLKQAQDDWPSLLARLERMRSTILDENKCRSGMFLDVTGDSLVLVKIQDSIDAFLNKLPGDAKGEKLSNFYSEKHPWVDEAKIKMIEMTPIIDEGFVVPSQVSYVGKAGLLYDTDEVCSGGSAVAARFLRTGYLWDHVRVMGGAYGGFCTFSPFSGFFSFLSYRDPNLAKTLDVYDAAADYLLTAADELENDQEALATAIIGTIGDMDGALSPDQKGFTSLQRWLINESPEYRQKYRDEILNTKAADFRDFAQRLKNIKIPSVAVVSSKAGFEAAAAAGKNMSLKDIF